MRRPPVPASRRRPGAQGVEGVIRIQRREAQGQGFQLAVLAVPDAGQKLTHQDQAVGFGQVCRGHQDPLRQPAILGRGRRQRVKIQLEALGLKPGIGEGVGRQFPTGGQQAEFQRQRIMVQQVGQQLHQQIAVRVIQAEAAMQCGRLAAQPLQPLMRRPPQAAGGRAGENARVEGLHQAALQGHRLSSIHATL